jgi:RNA polymerase sigma factor (sigma-70 family)
MFKSPKNTVDQTVSIIKQTLNGYTYDDIMGELKLRFVKCVKYYTKQEDGPPFTGFLYAYYKFMIKEWISNLSKDLLNTNTVVALEKVEGFTTTAEFTSQIKIFDDLNMFEKTELTNLEKYILYLHYEKNMRDREISRAIGLTRAYINKIKNSAIKKIKNSALTEDDLYGT